MRTGSARAELPGIRGIEVETRDSHQFPSPSLHGTAGKGLGCAGRYLKWSAYAGKPTISRAML